jgi:fermentation-respiration switch protein FrsA (DUF1100 family)
MAELNFTSDGHALAGTLELPAGAGPFSAALLLSGSGPLDRNSDCRRLRLGISRQLAEQLGEVGVASLRYDKRGVGSSGQKWRTVGLSDNIADARAALASLKARPEVDASRVFVIGHSEGALIAGALAADSPDVAGVVLLAGAARTGEETLRWQMRAILPTLPQFARFVLRVTRVDPLAKQEKNLARIKATTTDTAKISLAPINARWMREYLAYDPRADLARITAPVLAITGDKDLQVPAEDLAEIERLAGGPVETWAVEHVTHTLRNQPGPASLRAYRREVMRPVDPVIVSRILAWMKAHA